jgi:hypothetical protein
MVKVVWRPGRALGSYGDKMIGCAGFEYKAGENT